MGSSSDDTNLEAPLLIFKWPASTTLVVYTIMYLVSMMRRNVETLFLLLKVVVLRGNTYTHNIYWYYTVEYVYINSDIRTQISYHGL